MSDTIGSRLLRLRNARDLNQIEVAEAIGVGRPYLSSLERGKKVGTPQTLLALADFYNVSIDYLLRGIEAPFPGADKNCQPPYSAEELAMIELWREMDEDERRLVLSLINKVVRTSVA
ncbi:helix-turn-helix domain-containing protein [Acetobacter persici]|uniref:helix-turn-helix domain-containing protein n=1 Tax=Acetobacter persici TaxID=1076596 RepID=UPI001F37F8A9|nr:helix-turn-helix domain-containing protein [Acetobacter persici]MCG0997011.1 helix-turn-helix transcriptional regulator [Acetobacter persici]